MLYEIKLSINLYVCSKMYQHVQIKYLDTEQLTLILHQHFDR